MEDYGIEISKAPKDKAPQWTGEGLDGTGPHVCIPTGPSKCDSERGQQVQGSAQGGYEVAAEIANRNNLALLQRGGGHEVAAESKGGYTGAAAAQEAVNRDLRTKPVADSRGPDS
ncbi:hypothetical protein XA68_17040 [Ophiocordyceps unilateralis]|uniref:Uncharacterized protein n=1 Tax=Ophiocordyceps unilateralis TaxID=268505 RepID=A0A2A9PKW5_OPHUN|nr:hypothetical protein XA68_17040 [Ophiocordyceps unilateralis]